MDNVWITNRRRAANQLDKPLISNDNINMFDSERISETELRFRV